MGLKKKTVFLGVEIIFNNLGQILVRQIFINSAVSKYYKYLSNK